MNSLIAIKTALTLLFLTSITILVALIGAKAGNHQALVPRGDSPRQTAINTDGTLAIRNAFARVSFGRAVNSAGFLIIKNNGKHDDMLIGVSSKISKRTELHTHIRDGDIMRMRRVKGGIHIPKGSAARLQPGGFHIMFIGLKKPLKEGDHFPLTLIFKKAGKATLNMTARKKIPHGAPIKGGMKMHHDHRGSH